MSYKIQRWFSSLSTVARNHSPQAKAAGFERKTAAWVNLSMAESCCCYCSLLHWVAGRLQMCGDQLAVYNPAQRPPERQIECYYYCSGLSGPELEYIYSAGRWGSWRSHEATRPRSPCGTDVYIEEDALVPLQPTCKAHQKKEKLLI